MRQAKIPVSMLTGGCWMIETVKKFNVMKPFLEDQSASIRQ
jgi:hypothetical protein